MEIRYQIFEKQNLLIQKYVDALCLESYKKFIAHIMKITTSIKIDKVLIDFRDLKYNEFHNRIFEDINDLTEVRRDIEENQIKRNDILHVFWVDKPLQTVIAHLFSSNFPKLNYKYCSTVDMVISNLDLPEELHDIKKIADNLENTF